MFVLRLSRRWALEFIKLDPRLQAPKGRVDGVVCALLERGLFSFWYINWFRRIGLEF